MYSTLKHLIWLTLSFWIFVLAILLQLRQEQYWMSAILGKAAQNFFQPVKLQFTCLGNIEAMRHFPSQLHKCGKGNKASSLLCGLPLQTHIKFCSLGSCQNKKEKSWHINKAGTVQKQYAIASSPGSPASLYSYVVHCMTKDVEDVLLWIALCWIYFFSSLASYRHDSLQCLSDSKSLLIEAAVMYFEEHVNNTNRSSLFSTAVVTAM